MKTVTVVLLSWNRRETVLGCIDRVKSLVGAKIHIVVVDNRSSDGSPDAIRETHPDVTLLVEAVNGGFVGGVNRGLAEAARREADYAWLLNDDTQFDDDVLVPLLAYAENHPGVGLVSPRLVDLEGEKAVQFINGAVDWNHGGLRYNLQDDVEARLIESGATPVVPGTALLCDMRVYRAIGPFDSRYFAYWEDIDYAVRASRAGWANAIVEAATIRHSRAERHERPPHFHYYMIRNEALFFRLHGRQSTRWIRRWLAATFNWIGDSRDRGRTDQALALIDGLWDAARRSYGPRGNRAAAPRWMHFVLLKAPYALAHVVEGNLGFIARKLRGKP